MKLRQLIPVLIIAAGLWAYHNSFQGPFIFDDESAIPDNPHIRHLWPISQAMCAPYCAVIGRPVVCLTLALDYALGGLHVWGYHASNLTVHVLSALVLFGIIRRTLDGVKFRNRFGSASVWLAAAITLIWEVHPLQTECVDYIVQRTELLMGLFLLLTLYCVLRGSQSSRPGVWYSLAVVSCALGMGSKEVMVVAPLIVLLYDWMFLAASFREQWRQRWGLYLGLAGTWLILPPLMAGTHYNTVGFGRGVSPWQYLETQAGIIPYYLRLCFWPQPLVISYFDWPFARSLEDVLADGIIVLGLLAATVWAFRRRPWLGFLGAWFFLILAPTSSFLPILSEAAAERRMYLPLAAVVTLVVVGAFETGRRLLHRRWGFVVGCLAGGCVTALFTFLTIQRNRDYRSALTIWQDAVEKRPDNPVAHNFLGRALLQAGNAAQAIQQFQRALQLMPNLAQAHFNMATAFEQLGRTREAIKQYDQVLRLKPDTIEAQNNLAWLLATLAPEDGGNPVRGLELAQGVCKLAPNGMTAPYLDTLAAAYAATGQFSNAVATAGKAIDLARSNELPQVAAQIEPRLELYRSGRAYHQSVVSP